jgi:hypothetical protein
MMPIVMYFLAHEVENPTIETEFSFFHFIHVALFETTPPEITD